VRPRGAPPGRVRRGVHRRARGDRADPAERTAAVKLLGNLDCEARWSGAALPGAVQRRTSLYATLPAARAPDGARPEIWVPVEVDPARLIAHPRWTPPVVRAPPDALPGAFDLAWADPAAAAANDRSRALAIAGELGVALPGARVVASLAELDAHL